MVWLLFGNVLSVLPIASERGRGRNGCIWALQREFVVLSSQLVSSMTFSLLTPMGKEKTESDLTGAALARYRVPTRPGYVLAEWPWETHHMFQCCGSLSIKQRSFHLPQGFKVEERTGMDVRLQHSVMCVQGRVTVTALRLCVLLSGGPRAGHCVLVPLRGGGEDRQDMGDVSTGWKEITPILPSALKVRY